MTFKGYASSFQRNISIKGNEKHTENENICLKNCSKFRLFVRMVSTSDCHPRGLGFDSRLYPGNFSGSLGSGTRSTQPREGNWVTWYEK